MSKSFADKMTDAKLMAAGLKQHAETMAKFDVSETDVSELESLVSRAETLNIEQEKLKSSLKKCTTELNDALAKLDDVMAKSKSRVKVALPKEDWTAFGIKAKR